jgi:hypothetical protein
MSKWVGLAVNWIPIILAVAAYRYLLLRAIETRRCLAFFCGRPWLRGVKDFRIVVGLFEPDTDANEKPNERVLLVDQANRKILEPSGKCALSRATPDAHAPLRLTMESGSGGQLIPTASKAWVSHPVDPAALTEESKAAGRNGRLVITEDRVLWRYAPRADFMNLLSRWQRLVPLLSPVLSWDDANAAKAVNDILPDRQVRTTLHASIDFSRRDNIHDDPVLYIGEPRSRDVVIAIAQDRVPKGKVRYVKIEGRTVCELTPDMEDDRVAIVARIDRGKDRGVCTFVCGCSARITQQAGECLASSWKELWRRAQQDNKGRKSFLWLFRTKKDTAVLSTRPEIFPLPEHTS